MKFFVNHLSRGFLYTIGRFLAIAVLLILTGIAFSRFPKQDVNTNSSFIRGYFNEK